MKKELPNWVGYLILLSIIAGSILALVNHFLNIKFEYIKILAVSIVPFPFTVIIYALIRKEIFTGNHNIVYRWVKLSSDPVAFIMHLFVWCLSLLALIYCITK